MTTEFAQAFNGSEIRGQQIALYAKDFTQEDVKGLLAFYETDLGKKTIAAMPSLTREGAAMGEQWAKANMPRNGGPGSSPEVRRPDARDSEAPLNFARLRATG